MLMGFAIAHAWEDKRLLLGESLPGNEERRLSDIVPHWEGVEAVVDFRTVYVGPDDIIVAADVVFDASLDTEGVNDRISGIEDTLRETDREIRKVYIEPEG